MFVKNEMSGRNIGVVHLFDMTDWSIGKISRELGLSLSYTWRIAKKHNRRRPYRTRPIKLCKQCGKEFKGYSDIKRQGGY